MSCTDGCAAVGLECTEAAQLLHNGDVDSSAELLALIAELGGSCSASSCTSSDNNGAPNFSDDACFTSDSDRALDTFNCDHVAGGSTAKRRLCYCSGAPTPAPTPTPSRPPTPEPTLSECSASSYTELSDAFRHVSYGYGSNCDSTLAAGWYRFTGSAGERMPESTPGIYACGTHATGWLSDGYGGSGSHPAAGVSQSMTVCFDWSSDTCMWSSSVTVTNCNGEYYVYYISGTPACSLVYCGEASPTPAPTPAPSVSAVPTTYCGEGWTEIENTCFRYFSGTFDYLADYEEECAANGGSLATIASEAQNTVAYSLTGGGVTLIGLNDETTENDWVWADGSAVTYTNWASGQPIVNGAEDYAVFYYGEEWHDCSLSCISGYLCSFSAPTSMPTVTPVPSVTFSPTGPGICTSEGVTMYEGHEVYCFSIDGVLYDILPITGGDSTCGKDDANSCPEGTNIWVPRNYDHAEYGVSGTRSQRRG